MKTQKRKGQMILVSPKMLATLESVLQMAFVQHIVSSEIPGEARP